jgi:hypothetical protein
MTLKHCQLFTLLACTLFCGCLGLPYDITSTHAVRRLYYRKNDDFNKTINVSGCKLKLKRVDVAYFGEQAFTLEIYVSNFSPDISEPWIFTREHEFVYLNFANLRAVSLKEFPAPMTPEEKKEFIAKFSNLLWTGSVISGIKDIPKYKPGSLPAEVEKAIVTPDYTSDLVTVYTYTNLAGQVNQFRFAFTPEGKLKDIGRVEVAKDIGEFIYLL